MSETFQLVTRAEAARLCSVGVNVISEAIHSGQLRAKRTGRHFRIAVADLKAWYEQLPDA